jgi:tripartite-type tricarboxylate transporter receptor subunit TctC
VHYKGAAPAHQDLLAGRTHGMLDNLSAIRQHVQAGKLKAYAVSTRGRASQLPNVPSIIETGVVDFEVGSWIGLYAPAATPATIVERLRNLTDQLVRSPEFAARIESTGGAPLLIPRSRQAQFLVEEIARWDRLVKQAGI